MAVVVVVVAAVAVFGFRAWRAFESLETEAFDPDAADAALASLPNEEAQGFADRLSAEEAARFAAEGEDLRDLAEEETALLEDVAGGSFGPDGELLAIPYARSPHLPDDLFTSYLLIGSDASGALADTLIYVLLPADGSDPIMASIPRDLYLPNPCTQANSRINAGLAGCDAYASGTELLSLMVASYTGIEVDHFARVDFAGFARVINALGGVELCFDYPTRDLKSALSVPAGCRTAPGATVLAWVRSRRTEEFRNGAWRSAGASDFTRQRHQQELLFEVARKIGSFSSLGAFSEVVEGVVGSVRLDDGLSFTRALGLAWRYRGIQPDDVRTVEVSVENYRTAAGAQVLLPTATFNAALGEVYPEALR